MSPEPSSQQAVANRITALLPALVRTLNSENRIPWAQTLIVEDLKVSSIPAYFVTSDAAHSATSVAAKHAQGHVVKAGKIGSRIIITQVHDKKDVMVGDLSIHNRADGTLGIASIEFNDAGEVTKVHASRLYKDGSRLSPNSSEYIASLVSVLLMSASTNPASGVTCTSIDGIDVYEYKHGLDSDTEHHQHPVQYSPRVMPRMRNELAKELKHFPVQHGLNFNKTTFDYFKEIAESIEGSNELWWVSEDMTKLAWDVAMSDTGPEDLDESILPTPSGLMWLNGGGGPGLLASHQPDSQFFETGETSTELLSINAIAWYTPSAKSSGITGLEIGKPRFMGLTASPELAHDSTQWGGLISPLDVESNLIDYYRIPTYVTFYNLKFLPRKLALIVMRLAREETLGETRQETIGGGGQGKKHRDKQIETITCALLRRRQYASESEREAEAREYSHRWIVRGHMRNQPVGPRNAVGGQRHERVWIAPYVKGPEDKPLILKDRVQVWR